MPEPCTSPKQPYGFRKTSISIISLIRDNERIWQNKIHVIIGRDGSGTKSNVMGIVEDYSREKFWKTLHLGSGELASCKPFLDSVGCFVFYDRIMAVETLEIHEEQAIALVTTHEIGHALGMWHYPDAGVPPYLDNHVMVTNLMPAFKHGGFAKYGKFETRTLNGDYDIDSYSWDGMNTRHILGKDCVCIREK